MSGDMIVREHTASERASVVMIAISPYGKQMSYRLGKEGCISKTVLGRFSFLGGRLQRVSLVLS